MPSPMRQRTICQCAVGKRRLDSSVLKNTHLRTAKLRFFMDLSGNRDLLDRRLVAFFASRKATPHDTQLALQWAGAICQTDKVVISGFHSPLEKEVLNYLLERRHPVIFALGRALYKQIPPHLQSAFDAGNLLFVSFRDCTRQSWSSAQQCNWGAADLADEVCISTFDQRSTLNALHFTLDRYSDKAVYLLSKDEIAVGKRFFCRLLCVFFKTFV